jgi:flagellar basal body P-ring formation protein FlgA
MVKHIFMFRNSFRIALLILGGLSTLVAAESPIRLRSAAQSTADGVYLEQLVEDNAACPVVRLCDAPSFGKSLVLTRSQVSGLAQAAGLDLNSTNWAGAMAVRVSRRTRVLGESEALDCLKNALQAQQVKERGELELRFTRPWAPMTIPDEPLTLKVVDLPTAGVMPAFIARCEFETGQGERLGSWQACVQARVWREVWVAHSALKRGDLLRDSDVVRERRDVLLCRETLAEFERNDSSLELAESATPGSILLARSLKVRPVVFRGQTVAGLVQDGALAIMLKVEALEDGAPGQVIRVRNPISRRDLRGKVLDDQTILVSL